MKLYNKLMFVSALVLGLSACEMKEDLLSKNMAASDGTGALELSVATSNPSSTTRAAVETGDFPVTITNVADPTKGYSYTKASEMPASLQMPTGNYVVEAHSPGELLRMMSAPYYKGSEAFEIINSTTTSTSVVCKMANSRVRVELSDDFKAQFATWTITVSDGNDQVLAYDENSSYADIYWLFGENSTKIRVSIRAVTKDGNSVFAENEYTKANCDETYTDNENEAFAGGDAITIKFDPAVDPSGYVTGITVVTNVRFDNEDEDVSIEVKDEGAEDVPSVDPGDDPNTPVDPPTPPTPGDGPITVTYTPGQNVSIEAGATSYPAVSVDFAFEKGLKSLTVYVNSSNEAFQLACDDMNISGMDLASPEAEDLAAIFPLPTVGASTYQFTMGNLIWSMLSAYGAGVHTFKLTAVDAEDNTQDGVLTITVN